jgi:hypothetical protein
MIFFVNSSVLTSEQTIGKPIAGTTGLWGIRCTGQSDGEEFSNAR